jgi:AraC-like DNA-binding protein
MRKYYIDFAGSEAFSILSNAGLGEWTPLSVGAVHALIPIFEAIEKESSADSPLADAVCETLGRLLLLKIQQYTVSGRGRVPRSFVTYERLRTHIEAHYLRLHRVEDVAEECGVTPVHLSRLFGQFAQSGAYQFLMRLKMNHAAGLLENGASVKQVGELLGFADAFQFSRAFKRVHGVPPMQFKEARFG